MFSSLEYHGIPRWFPTDSGFPTLNIKYNDEIFLSLCWIIDGFSTSPRIPLLALFTCKGCSQYITKKHVFQKFSFNQSSSQMDWNWTISRWGIWKAKIWKSRSQNAWIYIHEYQLLLSQLAHRPTCRQRISSKSEKRFIYHILVLPLVDNLVVGLRQVKPKVSTDRPKSLVDIDLIPPSTRHPISEPLNLYHTYVTL